MPAAGPVSVGLRASPRRPPSPPSPPGPPGPPSPPGPPTPQLYRYRPGSHCAFPGRQSLRDGGCILHFAFAPQPVKPGQSQSNHFFNLDHLHHSLVAPTRHANSSRHSLATAEASGGGGSEATAEPLQAAHQYLTKSLIFMIPAPQPCLFVRILSLFAANHLKCLSVNTLHLKQSLSNQGQSSQIKPNQGTFLNHRAHHSITPIHYHFTQDSRQFAPIGESVTGVAARFEECCLCSQFNVLAGH